MQQKKKHSGKQQHLRAGGGGGITDGDEEEWQRGRERTRKQRKWTSQEEGLYSSDCSKLPLLLYSHFPQIQYLYCSKSQCSEC